MKFLRSILMLAAFAAVTLAPASAQSINQNYLFTPSGTMNIAATSTNTTAYLTNGASTTFRSLTYAAFQPTFRLTGSGTSACVFTFDSSVDGQSWTTGAFTISVTANGTNLVSTTSNQTIGSIPFYRLSGITNPNANAITNLYVATAGKTP